MKLLDYVLRGTPGHPIHPPLTDATIGAYTFGTIAAVLSKLGIAEEEFAHAWWLALVVALVVSAPTALTGLVDSLRISTGTPLKRTALLLSGPLDMATLKRFFVGTLGGVVLPLVLAGAGGVLQLLSP